MKIEFISKLGVHMDLFGLLGLVGYYDWVSL